MKSTPGESSRAVVFDLDGTLLDSLEFALRGLQYAVAPFSDVQLTMDIFPTLGGPPERYFRALVRNPDTDTPKALRRMREYLGTHGWDVNLYAGALETLLSLKQAGVKLAVWTGRDRASMTEIFERHSLSGLFMHTVCGDDLASHKPNPEGMYQIMQRLQVEPSDMLYLGDADVDAQGGRASGVKTILIQDRRAVSEETAQQAWRCVETRKEAYELALDWGLRR
jgi:HAD superfamily hydrolase (TIGR01509 family)